MTDIPNYYKDVTTGEWKPGRDPAVELIKTQRNRLLYESDWTQMPDVALLNKTAWATYRQELRDITSQPGYPNNVVWPTPPQG
jgi:hypothetical protein